MIDDRPVLLETRGHSLHITLNRPRAINALTHTMVRLIDEALTAAERDGTVTSVVLTGAGSAVCVRAVTSGPSTTTPAPEAGPRWTSGATSTA